MLETRAGGVRSRLAIPALFFVSAVFALLSWPQLAQAKGKGSIGVWAASDRYVLVIDKTIPGLVLVDLVAGVARERLVMESELVVGVASCPNCNYVLISSSRGEFWRLHFKDSLAALLAREGRLGFDTARVERIEVASAKGKLTDGRMSLVSDDGKIAYLASSKDNAVYRLDFTATPNAVPILTFKREAPFGLNWDNEGNILLSMHKRDVLRMTREGEIKATYNTEKAGCPGTTRYEPNLRAAFDDPVHADSLLILATNPKTYDAVVWRLHTDAEGKQSCTTAVGLVGDHPGWVDGSGADVRLGRSHHFTLLPAGGEPRAVISDTDNRAVRVLHLKTDSTSSIMYDRDRRISELPLADQRSAANCGELGWKVPVSSLSSGEPACVQDAAAVASALTEEAAESHCRAQKARLCEPAELRAAALPAAQFWTRAECAGCWLRRSSDRCAPEIETTKTVGTHKHKDFAQSWYSGQALENIVAGSTGTTACLAHDSSRTAAVVCCADTVPLGEEGE